jgi:hypothetical protein
MSFLVSKFEIDWDKARSIARMNGYESSAHKPLTESDERLLIRAGRDMKLVARRTKPRSNGRLKRRMSQGASRVRGESTPRTTSTYSRSTWW